MLTDATRRMIRDVLVHQPFCCEALYMYLVTGDVLTAQDPRSKEFLIRFRTHIDALAKEESRTPVWCGGLRSVGGTIESGQCYGWVRVDDLVVVVEKRLNNISVGPNVRLPIDSYFMRSVYFALVSILQRTVTSDGPALKQPDDDLGIFAELSSLERLGSDWRKRYGAEKWLAIAGCTVIATGESREMLEQRIQKQGVTTPILYVPPQSETQVLDLFSVG